MCGIITLFSTGSAIQKESVLAGLKALHHRGPDKQNIWESQSGNIALGHARLSIIDLNTGDQPITNADETVAVAVNGEFYDYENIREDLIKCGHQFKTLSDSEIALHLYAKYGTACLSYLRGEFSFNLWDEKNKLLFAARDRFGIKPLFYCHYEGILYIASEIKSILAAGVPAQWDYESYANRGFIYRDRTLFKNIHQVPPGHFLLADKDSIRIIKYWDFNYPVDSDIQDISENEIISEVQKNIAEAIRLRLRADVPVAVYLSGGIDSSSVLGIASKLHNRPIDAYTLSFEHEDYDEFSIAEETAKLSGANFHPIRIKQSDLADHFSDAIWHAETSCINAHGVAKYLLSKAVNQAGYKVVLTGEGADEIFAGYPPFRQDNILHNLKNKDNGTVKKLHGENKVSSGALLIDEAKLVSDLYFLSNLIGFKPAWLLAQQGMIENYINLYSKEFACNIKSVEPLWHFINYLDINQQIYNRNPVHISMYLMSKSLLPNYVLCNLGDRMEMAHSVEGRTPYLDHHLVEHAVKLPTTMKINNMTEKYVLREAVKPYVSQSIYERKKHPFLAPPSILNPKEKLYQFAQDTINSACARKQPFFDMDEVLAYMDKTLSQDINTQISTEPIIMEILSLCVLQNRYSLGA